MKSSIKGQEKGDLLIQVTVWVGFTIYIYIYINIYNGTCLIRHTKGPGKCVVSYRMSEYSGFILVNRNFCRMSQNVGKLSCRIAQVPLYNLLTRPLQPKATTDILIKLNFRYY
jgi:hypothetical protein